MSTFVDLYTDLLNLGGQDATGDALVMAKNAINRAYRRTLSLSGQVSSQREFSITTVASTSQYGLGPYIKRVLNIDDGANNRQIPPITKADYDGLYPGTTSSGDPSKYYLLGVYGANAQPSSASALEFKSDNSLDTGTVRVTGFVGGVYSHETITLNGATGVSTTKSYTSLERITKLQATTTVHTGTITATSNSAAVTVVVIPFHMDSASHLWLEFHPNPSTVRTYTIRAEMNKPNMINDADWPDIDEDFHDAILYLAAGEALPAFGSEGLGSRMLEEGKDEIEALAGTRVSRNIVRQFIDVTTSAGVGPQRPLISGIDVN